MTSQFSIVDGKLHIQGALPEGFQGQAAGARWLCPLDARNASALRRFLTWAAPVPVGQRLSFGFGDRLGLATPGHITAVQGTGVFPVLAQQSPREMALTGRTPQQVLDDVTWAVLASDYQDGFGSDAAGLRTLADLEAALSAGFTGFTLDCVEAVDQAAPTDEVLVLANKYLTLPWDDLETTPDDLKRLYGAASFQKDRRAPRIFSTNAEAFYRTACKLGPALAHVRHLSRFLADKTDGRTVDLEIALDDSDAPTTPHEHMFFALELKRLGVKFTGLALRWSGGFESGVDYIGDITVFERELAAHARIAREFGPYKLSLHNGSDKFSLYPLLAKLASPHLHIKTSGTSWLEALRVLAQHEPDLLRELLAYAVECYPRDRAAAKVSAKVWAKVWLLPGYTGSGDPTPRSFDKADMATLLDNSEARQVLHVTFGSLLAKFRDPIYAVLHAHNVAYQQGLASHFRRHLSPFIAP